MIGGPSSIAGAGFAGDAKGFRRRKIEGDVLDDARAAFRGRHFCGQIGGWRERFPSPCGGGLA